MNQKPKSNRSIRRTPPKQLLVLPALVLPFTTLLFWSLGGGREEDAGKHPAPGSGINSTLPVARQEDYYQDKMSYYDQARRDSLKFRRLADHDPNYNPAAPSESTGEKYPAATSFGNSPEAQLFTSAGEGDIQAQKIYRKLAELDKELAGHPDKRKNTAPPQPMAGTGREMAVLQAGDLDRLEQMMRVMHTPGGQNPELQQLDGMLEKILDIQHPQRVQGKHSLAEVEVQPPALSVSMQADEPFAALWGGTAEGNLSQRFYSLERKTLPEAVSRALEAEVTETQTITAGATVKLRLKEAVYIQGTFFPPGHLIVGTASLDKERLYVHVGMVRHGSSLFPVALSAYDHDGKEGLHIPGAITREVAGPAADRTLRSLGGGTSGLSWGAKAAGAGMEAAQTLLTKKVRQVKVTLRAGYRLLLQDPTQKGRSSTLTFTP